MGAGLGNLGKLRGLGLGAAKANFDKHAQAQR